VILPKIEKMHYFQGEAGFVDPIQEVQPKKKKHRDVSVSPPPDQNASKQYLKLTQI
jgi:hypothetical protein